MSDRPGTAESLLHAGQELFAEHGYDGASIRAITSRAGANLGAVTYHFGSKEALYHAVIESKIRPVRERLLAAAGGGGPALDRIESFLRTAFDYYTSNPGLPRLMLQQIASGRPAPPPAREWIRLGLGTLGELIRTGQVEGNIRAGEPRLMALGVVSTLLFVHLIRRPLEESTGLSLDDAATREAVREQAVRFVRDALAAPEAA
jgi:AcrR family transcriptional regulator